MARRLLLLAVLAATNEATVPVAPQRGSVRPPPEPAAQAAESRTYDFKSLLQQEQETGAMLAARTAEHAAEQQTASSQLAALSSRMGSLQNMLSRTLAKEAWTPEALEKVPASKRAKVIRPLLSRARQVLAQIAVLPTEGQKEMKAQVDHMRPWLRRARDLLQVEANRGAHTGGVQVPNNLTSRIALLESLFTASVSEDAWTLQAMAKVPLPRRADLLRKLSHRARQVLSEVAVQPPEVQKLLEGSVKQLSPMLKTAHDRLQRAEWRLQAQQSQAPAPKAAPKAAPSPKQAIDLLPPNLRNVVLLQQEKRQQELLREQAARQAAALRAQAEDERRRREMAYKMHHHHHRSHQPPSGRRPAPGRRPQRAPQRPPPRMRAAGPPPSHGRRPEPRRPQRRPEPRQGRSRR